MKFKVGDYVKYTYNNKRRGYAIYRVIEIINENRYLIGIVIDFDNEKLKFKRGHTHTTSMDYKKGFTKIAKEKVMLEVL